MCGLLFLKNLIILHESIKDIFETQSYILTIKNIFTVLFYSILDIKIVFIRKENNSSPNDKTNKV